METDRSGMKRLEGKVAVMAGGAGGIGTSCSRRLAAEGARVIVGDLNGDEAHQVAEDIGRGGGTATACRLDLADPESVRAMFGFAVSTYGGVDLLHCNAASTGGLGADTDALDIDMAAWERSLTVNLTGYLLCTRAALPLMLARGGGAIVYTSSGASITGETIRVAYGVAKAGVNALARHVALRWGKEGIRANCVSPGLVMTPPARALPQERLDELLGMTPGTRLGEPEDIAAMVAMLLSPDGEWINGQTYVVDGGMLMR